MRSCLLLMMSDLSVPWSGELYAKDASGWRGRAWYAPVARELVSASGRFSEGWRLKLVPSLGVRTLARHEVVDTACQEKVKIPHDLCTSVS